MTGLHFLILKLWSIVQSRGNYLILSYGSYGNFWSLDRAFVAIVIVCFYLSAFVVNRCAQPSNEFAVFFTTAVSLWHGLPVPIFFLLPSDQHGRRQACFLIRIIKKLSNIHLCHFFKAKIGISGTASFKMVHIYPAVKNVGITRFDDWPNSRTEREWLQLGSIPHKFSLVEY